MADQELIDWIKNSKSQGYNNQQLYNALVQRGYNPNEANQALGIASEKNTQINQKSEPLKKPFNFLYIIIIGVVIIGLASAGIFLFYFQEQDVESEEHESEQILKETQDNALLESELQSCIKFPDKLESCEPFSCEFDHPFTSDLMERQIVGLEDDKCKYSEEMPNNGRMDCEFTESLRKAMAKYHKDIAASESSRTDIKADLGSGDVETTYMIDGKQVQNPLQEALITKQCVISGYGVPDTEGKCPEGTEYKGETFTYENGGKTAHPICSDPNLVCSPCENCVTGSEKKVIQIGMTEEACHECVVQRDCIEGYKCDENKCVTE
ncbi:hypothetical protein CMO92_00960 [Candidatus Woesearchaeota archaeon]|nr:hypothetical protein [Candidatus Woesearchaeota archaeon]